MKIGVIAHLKYPIREPFAGGLEMHTYLLCKLLRQRGHAVTLFASAGSADDLGLEPICDETPPGAINAADHFRREHRTYFKLMETLRDAFARIGLICFNNDKIVTIRSPDAAEIDNTRKI